MVVAEICKNQANGYAFKLVRFKADEVANNQRMLKYSKIWQILKLVVKIGTSQSFSWELILPRT